jgi:hypothetical protein
LSATAREGFLLSDVDNRRPCQLRKHHYVPRRRIPMRRRGLGSLSGLPARACDMPGTPSGMGNPLTQGSMHVFVTDQRPDCGTTTGEQRLPSGAADSSPRADTGPRLAVASGRVASDNLAHPKEDVAVL